VCIPILSSEILFLLTNEKNKIIEVKEHHDECFKSYMFFFFINVY
jgi:hypothetical protein